MSIKSICGSSKVPKNLKLFLSDGFLAFGRILKGKRPIQVIHSNVHFLGIFSLDVNNLEQWSGSLERQTNKNLSDSELFRLLFWSIIGSETKNGYQASSSDKLEQSWSAADFGARR